jgi:EPS-associated MarR family transcriptional regulator
MLDSQKTATTDCIQQPESIIRNQSSSTQHLEAGNQISKTSQTNRIGRFESPFVTHEPFEANEVETKQTEQTGSTRQTSARHHTQILRDLHKNPYISQREIALKNRISLGKVNYAIRSLLDKGYIKVQNFKNAKNKRQYTYFLTPAGMSETARRTSDFLKWKMEEYERIKREIMELEQDLQAHAEDSGF